MRSDLGGSTDLELDDGWSEDRAIGAAVLIALAIVGAYVPIWPGLPWDERWRIGGSLVAGGLSAVGLLSFARRVVGSLAFTTYCAFASVFVIVADLALALLFPMQWLAVGGMAAVFLVYFQLLDRERATSLQRWNIDMDLDMGPVQRLIALRLVSLIGWDTAIYWYSFFSGMADRHAYLVPGAALSPLLGTLPVCLGAVIQTASKLAGAPGLPDSVVPLFVTSAVATLVGGPALSMYGHVHRLRGLRPA